ncbi:hypothetical protein [Halorientalis halophila]|uniref:hypothetical protein n=1 Tax=Halorientalis halophila TaxID=3108499 RepID=UPI00300A3714
MRTTVVAALVACLVVGAAIPAAGYLADAGPAVTDDAATDGSAQAASATTNHDASGTQGATANVTHTSGSRLAGTVGSQQADIAAEIDTRTLLVRLGRADSASERAAVLSLLEARTDERLGALSDRRERIRAAAENRSISAGEYAYVAASVSVEAAASERLAERGERAATDLPESVAAEYGVSATAFEALGDRSRSVTASLESDVRAFAGARVAANLTGEAALDANLDASDLLDRLNETVDPGNRTDWSPDDETLEDVLGGLDEGDSSDGENESLDGIVGNQSDGGLLDGTDESETTDGGLLDGIENETTTDGGLLEGSDGDSETDTSGGLLG